MFSLRFINNWIVSILIVLLFILFIIFTIRLAKFHTALNYINGEIHRTRGSERAYWKKEKLRIIHAFIIFRPIK